MILLEPMDDPADWIFKSKLPVALYRVERPEAGLRNQIGWLCCYGHYSIMQFGRHLFPKDEELHTTPYPWHRNWWVSAYTSLEYLYDGLVESR